MRNVGILLGSIVRISTEPLQGTEVVDARGLVVAPGFVDLNDHEQTAEGYRLKALDGVTTGLGMEIRAPDIQAFLTEHEGKALINCGTTASYLSAWTAVFGDALPHDPQTITDRATYDKPNEPSVGVKYLIVNGHSVIENGEIVHHADFGHALTGKDCRF